MRNKVQGIFYGMALILLSMFVVALSAQAGEQTDMKGWGISGRRYPCQPLGVPALATANIVSW